METLRLADLKQRLRDMGLSSTGKAELMRKYVDAGSEAADVEAKYIMKNLRMS